MKTDPILPRAEREIRIAATAPDVDAWVSANAGSGKTTILGNRVIRLLLVGTPPDRILCLTFTKAAAAEMQARIFRELARWVTLEDVPLKAVIASLVGPDGAIPDQAALRHARTLFARAIEAPGGLKIQTIHAFAERILHLFPVEAGVPLDFEVLGDVDASALRDQARRMTIEAATRTPASALGRAFGELVNASGIEAFATALDCALGDIGRLRNRGEDLPPVAERAAIYRAAFGVDETESEGCIEADFAATALAADQLERAAEAVTAQKKPSETQLRLAANLAAVAQRRRNNGRWHEPYRRLFLTAKGEIAKPALFIKAVIETAPWLAEAESCAKADLATYLQRRLAFRAYTRSLALTDFADAVHRRFLAAKRARSTLDFDDLIAALRRLLQSEQAAWVRLKLDSAIEHVLVDEAQDTTPEMWDIVRALTDEFFAGDGVSRRKRTLFVVGDEKQSIYSFQGADPAVFEESRRHFAAVALDGRFIKKPIALNYSFRSSDDVLGAVDRVFATPERRAGLSAGAEHIHHVAARQRFPGQVELWPLERPVPVDEGAPKPPPPVVMLAQRIADQIAGWLASGARHLEDGTPIQPGDILILVRKRGPFFSAVLRALRSRGVPVAGADRLKLQEEIAIHDLLVIAEAVLQREDDLALATALKTPLFGLSEAELEYLARGRSGSLRDALAASTEPRLVAFEARLTALRDHARVASPFEFFAALLVDPAPGCPVMSGRKALLTRLGPDAGDPLDAFLIEAQNFARQAPAALLPFVLDQRRRVSEIKRDLEQGSERVRIMTVHGAKGLEGRIVFLGDTADPPSRGKEAPAFLLRAKGEAPLLCWAGSKGDEPELMRAARGLERAKLLGEYRRLLYVGMTRASDRLYLTGHGRQLPKDGEKPPPDDAMEWSWHQLASVALADVPEIGSTAVGAMQGVRRLVSAVPPAPPTDSKRAAKADAPPVLPDWVRRAPDAPKAEPLPPLRPSAGFASPSFVPGGAAAPGFARQRGIILHRLYELLPRVDPEQRRKIGGTLLAGLAPDLRSAEIDVVLDPVLKLMASPEGIRIFGAQSRAEVALAGEITLSDGTRRAVAGRIDRLIVVDHRVEIIDLKTGRPHAPEEDFAILRQMALYRALLAAIYPGHEIACRILWTETGVLADLAGEALDHALAGITAE